MMSLRVSVPLSMPAGVIQMLIKQHAVIDVLAGLVVGFLGNYIVYGIIGRRRDRRLRREA